MKLGTVNAYAKQLLDLAAHFVSKRALARLLSTFLCCLAIAIHPVARLGGHYAFLVLPFQALIYSVQESLAQQLELTVLNIIGAIAGIGFSTLGKYVASTTAYGSTRSRATCAVFLIAISFFAGLIKSRLPRLTVSMRICIFVSVWLLTIDIGFRSRVLADSGNFLYAVIAPATISVFSLLFVMSFLRWSSSSFEGDMAATFVLLQRCLSLSLDNIMHSDAHSHYPPHTHRANNGDVEDKEGVKEMPASGRGTDNGAKEYQQLRSQLFQKSVLLNETYSQAAFELRIGRLSLKSIRPLIGIVEHLRRELAWGMAALHRPHLALSPQRTRTHMRPTSSRASSRLGHRRPTSPLSAGPGTPSRPASVPTSPAASVRRLAPRTSTPPAAPWMGVAPPYPEACERFKHAMEAPAQELGRAVSAAMRAVELVIGVAFDLERRQGAGKAQIGCGITLPFPLFSRRGEEGKPDKKEGQDDVEEVKNVLSAAQETLISARDEAREKLGKIFDDMDSERRTWNISADSGDEADYAYLNLYPKEVLDGCLVMIALLQMAQEMRTALNIASELYTQHADARVRLWYPHLTLAWLGVPSVPLIADDPESTLELRFRGMEGGQRYDAFGLPLGDEETNLTTAETNQGLVERGFGTGVEERALPVGRLGAERLPGGLSYAVLEMEREESVERRGRPRRWRWRWGLLSLPDIISAACALPWVLRSRIQMARVHRGLMHSPHLRHAMKNAIGVAVLTFPAFMPMESRGRTWFESWHGQWMVISYVWVLETNTGATWRSGYLRLVGTSLAALYAYIITLICHTNPYGLTALVTIADIPLSYLITRMNLAPLAVPAAVTIPIIAFDPYINPEPDLSVLKLAAIRALMIAVGIFAALLVNALIFPRHCRVLFLSDSSRTLGLLSQLYMSLSHNMFRRRQTLAHLDRRKTLKLELQIRNNVHRLYALIVTMHDEISLLPKPLAHYHRVVATMQRLLDAMTGLRKIRENIPRREAVSHVFNERREFMSCVCITLYACQHAFRAREPLPQFLPSPRHALDNLEMHLQDSIRRAREEDVHALGLSLVYAFAEQEVMKNMVDTLEELLELSGRLFGTSTWLTHEQHLSMVSLHEEASDSAWYSIFKWEEV